MTELYECIPKGNRLSSEKFQWHLFFILPPFTVEIYIFQRNSPIYVVPVAPLTGRVWIYILIQPVCRFYLDQCENMTEFYMQFCLLLTC